MSSVFQTLEALVGDSNQMLGLFAILRESCDTVVHRDR